MKYSDKSMVLEIAIPLILPSKHRAVKECCLKKHGRLEWQKTIFNRLSFIMVEYPCKNQVQFDNNFT